jgi:hypothetical protein
MLAVALSQACWAPTDSEGLSTSNKDTASHENWDCATAWRKALHEGRDNRNEAANSHCPAATRVIRLAQVNLDFKERVRFLSLLTKGPAKNHPVMIPPTVYTVFIKPSM